MSSTSMGIDILNRFVVVGGNRLPIRKIQQPQGEITSEHPEPEVDGVGVPVSVMNEIKEEMSALRNEVADLKQKVDSRPSEQPNPPYAEFLGRRAKEIDPRQCFIAMPYSKPWSSSVEKLLKESCANAGMKALVAKNMDGRVVAHDIWEGITGSSIIVADMTDGNPNVAYEVGLADVLGKRVILLCQGNTVPFDFQGQRLILYESTLDGSFKLKEELSTRLLQLQKTVQHA
jgi:hypothetical protein